MQPNTITLAVDLLNTGSTTDQIFTRQEQYLNRSVYIGPTHSVSLKDTLTFYRSPIKPSGNFPGVAKVSAKFSTDYAIPGVDGATTLIAPQIFEVSCSTPVGVTEAQQMIARQRGVALWDMDTIVGALMALQSI
jgi:hypothetical protein